MLALTLYLLRPTADVERLACQMLDGPAFPFRLRLAYLLAARSRLSVDADLLARALQWQTGNPEALDVSGVLDAAVAQVMMGGIA